MTQINEHAREMGKQSWKKRVEKLGEKGAREHLSKIAKKTRFKKHHELPPLPKKD